jgi:hypothetical protein
VPADGTGAANYESGDFGTSPFFLGSSQASRGPPVSVYHVAAESKAQWCSENLCAIEVAVVVLATSMMTVVLANFRARPPVLPSSCRPDHTHPWTYNRACWEAQRFSCCLI